MNVKLAKLFVEKGYLSLDNLKSAVEEQKNKKKSLGEILITRGYITESQLIDLTNLDNQFSTVDLTTIDIPQDVINSIPKDTAVENNLIPFKLDGSFLSVAMIDPTNLVLIDELRFLTGHNIKPYITEFSNIKNALIKYHNIASDETVSQPESPVQQTVQRQEVVQQAEPEPQVPAQTEPQPEPAPVQAQHEPPQPPQPTPEQKSVDTSAFVAAQQAPPPSQPQDEPGFQSSAEPREEVKQQLVEEPKPDISVPEVGVTTKEGTEQKSTTNEIIDVFAKDDADYVRDTKETSEPGSFDSISLESSSQDSDNLFQTPQEQTVGPEQGITSTQANVQQNTEQNIFQAPQQPAAGFETAQTSGFVYDEQPEASVAKGASEQIDVFSSSGSQQSADDEDEDKTIELSIEAEEVTDEVVESKEVTDVFSVPPQEGDSPVQSNKLSAFASNQPFESQESTESSEDSKNVEDLFKIPEPQPEQGALSSDKDQKTDSEPDLRSLNEDSSYDNIESFNKSIDDQIDSFSKSMDSNNGNQSPTPSFNDDAAETDLKRLETVDDNIAQTEKPSEPEPEPEPIVSLSQDYEQRSEAVAKPTVLVVDDSPTVQKIVSVTLSRQGYKVEVSSNAMQALAKLNDFIPDIIFLDINLPHMDGYQLCKIIKGNELTKEVPVVMLSGKDGFFDKMRGKMVGATDYITKPFEPNTLVSAIKKQGISISGAV